MKQKKKKNVERGVKLEEGGGGNFGVAQEFSCLAHQNTIFPNGRKNCAKLFRQKCPFKLTVCVRTCLSFLFLLKKLF